MNLEKVTEESIENKIAALESSIQDLEAELF